LLALDSSGISTRLVDTATRALKPGEASRLVHTTIAARIFTQARDLTRDLEELAGLQAPELPFRHGHVLGRVAAGRSAGSHGIGQFTPARCIARPAISSTSPREVLAGKLEFAVGETTGAERHPTRLAIEPVAEHRMFFFVRQGHPLVAAKEHSLETILVFPLVSPRLPQRNGRAPRQGRDACAHRPRNGRPDAEPDGRQLRRRAQMPCWPATRWVWHRWRRWSRTSGRGRFSCLPFTRTVAAAELRPVLYAQASAVARRADCS
jgi:hypothetical protein